MIGAARAITQLFAYEVPLVLSILAPALLADTWSLSELTKYYSANPLHMLINVIGLGVGCWRSWASSNACRSTPRRRRRRSSPAR